MPPTRHAKKPPAPSFFSENGPVTLNEKSHMVVSSSEDLDQCGQTDLWLRFTIESVLRRQVSKGHAAAFYTTGKPAAGAKTKKHCSHDDLTWGRFCPCKISCFFCKNVDGTYCNKKKWHWHTDFAFQKLLTNSRHPSVRNAEWLSANQMVTCHQYWLDSSACVRQLCSYSLTHVKGNNN